MYNGPSKKLAKQAGFELEFTRKQFSLENDEWTDFLVYYQNNND